MPSRRPILETPVERRSKGVLTLSGARGLWEATTKRIPAFLVQFPDIMTRTKCARRFPHLVLGIDLHRWRECREPPPGSDGTLLLGLALFVAAQSWHAFASYQMLLQSRSLGAHPDFCGPCFSI